MLEILFSSRVRAKLLTTLFMSPGVGHNAWELAKSIGETYSAVWKELVRLESIDILTYEQKSRIKIYHINPDCPITPELRSMILKTAGIGDAIRSHLSGLKNLKQVFIYGSYASGEADHRSDLDLMVIGNVKLTEFASIIAQLEKDLRRPINYVLSTEDDWKLRIESEDPFAMNVMRSPQVQLIGGEDAL
jgi:predicted nucleotidyltransferase